MPSLSFPRFSQEGTGLGPQVLWLPPRGMPLQSPGSGSQPGLPSQAPQDCNKQTVLNQPPAREQCGSSRQAPVFPGKRPVSTSSQLWGRRGGAASAHIPRSLQAVGRPVGITFMLALCPAQVSSVSEKATFDVCSIATRGHIPWKPGSSGQQRLCSQVWWDSSKEALLNYILGLPAPLPVFPRKKSTCVL